MVVTGKTRAVVPAERRTMGALRDPDMQRALDEYLSREHDPERERRDQIRLLRWARRLLSKS